MFGFLKEKLKSAISKISRKVEEEAPKEEIEVETKVKEEKPKYKKKSEKVKSKKKFEFIEEEHKHKPEDLTPEEELVAKSILCSKAMFGLEVRLAKPEVFFLIEGNREISIKTSGITKSSSSHIFPF